MKQFTIAKVTQLGEPDIKYGTRFWCEVNEQLEPVMFNLMSGEPKVGDSITAETVELKTSAKGTEYHGLKKVKVAAAQAVLPVDTGAKEQLDRIEKKIDQLLGTDDPAPVTGDEPINLEDVPF